MYRQCQRVLGIERITSYKKTWRKGAVDKFDPSTRMRCLSTLENQHMSVASLIQREIIAGGQSSPTKFASFQARETRQATRAFATAPGRSGSLRDHDQRGVSLLSHPKDQPEMLGVQVILCLKGNFYLILSTAT
ncbi:hypothetical protein FOXG_06108 [Fusarium oxysporum f. sp. lycopersici 4287]|uniref:Uncharacterized protein n=2 Tax=Fusarium oxysporum TaxID=5507 RepID=A0A0J9UX56_FUSO4|nr:hypothetical protein FOXG_06108 [Fusarium oxysporum f. sp. lycopersici 4287]KNB03720.1 hypothetical protein FOXG_06108 [Fusarium oxysporum f. sp. lycopersici 4287]